MKKTKQKSKPSLDGKEAKVILEESWAEKKNDTYQIKLKCSCGSEEVLGEMAENAIQIHIGSSDINKDSKLVLDCKNCGAKIGLEIVKKEEDVSEEIRNEG